MLHAIDWAVVLLTALALGLWWAVVGDVFDRVAPPAGPGLTTDRRKAQ